MTERYKKLLSEIYPSGKLYDELLPEGDPLDKTGLFRYGVLFCLGYIGCGSFFDVYRAVDIHGRAYAVKVMRINEQSTRFPLSPLDVTRRVFGEIELLEKLKDAPGVLHITRYYPGKAAIREHIRRSEENGSGRFCEKQPQIVATPAEAPASAEKPAEPAVPALSSPEEDESDEEQPAKSGEKGKYTNVPRENLDRFFQD